MRRQIGEAAIAEIAQHVAAGTVAPAHLKPLALACLADVMQGNKARDVTRAAEVVRKWLADESDKPGVVNVTAVQIVLEEPSRERIASGPAAFPANGIEIHLDSNGAGMR